MPWAPQALDRKDGVTTGRSLMLITPEPGAGTDIWYSIGAGYWVKIRGFVGSVWPIAI